MYKNVTIVIPSYKPDEKLISTVRGVREAGFSDIIVVDDGGGEKYAEYFRRVESEFGCTVLTHEINRGKGAALKTAFAYYIENRPDSVGLVTADADGQHLPKDMIAVAEQMAKSQSVVLGCRDFSEPHVPPRSKVGNRTTSAVFKMFLGMKISDTQTGLRAFPRHILPLLGSIEGDRFEYETNMLLKFGQHGITIREEKIETVYIEENRTSHFRTVRDSLRVYRFILSFILSSLISFVADL
jgi:glycosyltransferase involved in cell wall biosynthesis